MKKFVSLVLTVALLVTMLTVFAIPAFAVPSFAVPASAVEVPLSESTVSVNAAETLGGPAEDLEVPVDGDGNVTVPAEGASGFWQIGASTLSEGSLVIIVGIAAAVVFGLGGFFIGKAAGKKKKPALVSGESKNEG